MTLQGIDKNDDNFRCAYLEANLTGAGLGSIKEVKKAAFGVPPKKYADLVQGLTEIYPVERDSDVHQQLLYDRKQRQGESVT